MCILLNTVRIDLYMYQYKRVCINLSFFFAFFFLLIPSLFFIFTIPLSSWAIERGESCLNNFGIMYWYMIGSLDVGITVNYSLPSV